MGTAVGIDIGGTFARFACVDDETGVLARARRSLPGSPEDLLTLIDEWVGQAAASSDGPLGGVGLAVPGILTDDQLRVARSINVPYLCDMDLVEIVSHHTSLPAKLITDVDAAAWGEYVARRGKVDPLVHLRIGTGIGLGVVSGGSPAAVARDGLRHASMLMVQDPRWIRSCPCGGAGCLEAIASGSALTQAARQMGVGELAAIDAAYQREGEVRHLIHEVAEALLSVLDELHAYYEPALMV
ncbi:MAG: ROK family protein, partial [Planctomycetota bacterium]